MSEGSSYQAFLEQFRFGRLSGWAWNSADPERPVELAILVNGSPAGSALADRFRPDLADAGIRNGYAGYSFPLQPDPTATFPLQVEVRVAATGHLVQNGSVSVPSQYEGYVDSIDAAAVHGWVWNVFDPAEEVELAVFADEQLVGTCRADTFRGDLQDAGIGTGRHGFTFDLLDRRLPGGRTRLRVEVRGTGVVLVGGDREVELPRQARWQGALDDRVRDGRLAGWLRDDQTGAPADICLLVDGNSAAYGTADLPHPDAGGPFGFDLLIPAAFLHPGTLNIGVALRDTGEVVLAARPLEVRPADIAFGAIDPVRADAVRGWAVDLADLDAACSVDVHADGVDMGTIECNQMRQDLVEVFGGRGRHGFEFRHPEEFFDGRRHVVRFFHGSTQAELNGSPVTLEPAFLRGLLLDTALERISR